MIVGVIIVVAVLVAVAASAFTSARATRWRLERSRAQLSTILERERDADDARHRMMDALDAIPGGVVLLDEEGRERFRNAFAREFAGGRHAEVLVEQAIGEVLRAALAGVEQQRDVDLIGPPKRSLVISAFPLDVGSVRTGALAILEDVSARRHLDTVRRDFVANISHELKTPVGALGLLAETIATEDDPAVVRRLAERMTMEAHRVARIIDDLLALSRIEGETAPDHALVPVPTVISEAVARVAGLAEAHRIRIDTEDVDANDVVLGDRRQLVAAVANLLENACNYSDDGSSVHVVSRRQSESIEIAVRDEGAGIPTSDLERIFERFYRVDRSRRRETGGTGLGLSIVRHVVENHGGEVRVESREGEGSTFTLRLPAVAT